MYIYILQSNYFTIMPEHGFVALTPFVMIGFVSSAGVFGMNRVFGWRSNDTKIITTAAWTILRF